MSTTNKVSEAEQRRTKARDAELAKLYRPIGSAAIVGALACRFKRKDDKVPALRIAPQSA